MTKTKYTKRDNDGSTSVSLQDMLAAIKRADKNQGRHAKGFQADADFVTNSLRAEFVAQVRAVMKERGMMKPAELARRSGLSRERISKILQEKGNIELRTIARIATALEAPVVVRVGRKNVETVAAPQPQPARTVVVHVQGNDYYSEAGSWASEPGKIQILGEWKISTSIKNSALLKSGRKGA